MVNSSQHHNNDGEDINTTVHTSPRRAALSGKHLQSGQGKPTDTDLSTSSITNADLAAILAALKQTTDALQGQ
ncbi:hypothetical protein A2U01_0064964, partial [Trifolium medium]|nr:hypothetical protein [Trifolium medium]